MENKEFFEAFKIEARYTGNEYSWFEKAYPEITSDIILELEDIVNEHYNILIIEKFSNSTRITAHPAPDENLGADEAYFRVTAIGDTKKDALLGLCVKLKEDIKDKVREMFPEEE
jgi:hypothetical protein